MSDGVLYIEVYTKAVYLSIMTSNGVFLLNPEDH